MIHLTTVDPKWYRRIALLLILVLLIIIAADCSDEADWEQRAPIATFIR